MKQYDICCPLCGSLNLGIDLLETDGRIECDVCHTPSRVISLRPLRVIPCNDGENRPFHWSKIAML